MFLRLICICVFIYNLYLCSVEKPLCGLPILRGPEFDLGLSGQAFSHHSFSVLAVYDVSWVAKELLSMSTYNGHHVDEPEVAMFVP